MTSSPTLIFMITFFLESLAAMLQNGFMVTELGREWVRSRAMPTGDMIIICLAASRLCLHGLSILSNLLTFSTLYYKNHILGVFWDFVNTLTLWLTAWLAVFYCVKISSFSHPVFFWLKWRISWLVPRLLLSSLIFSALSAISAASAPLILVLYGNYTRTQEALDVYKYYYHLHAMLMWLPPFLLFTMSLILLMSSLYRHVGQMRDHRPGPRDPSTQAHTMALKSLAFFLTFHTWYGLSLCISTMKVRNSQSPEYWVSETITYAAISLHSIILMLSSPKLRKALRMRFSCCS